MALGLSEMPGDFINAYVLGSVGDTAGIIGACATFLYNVKQGMEEIRAGRKRVVIVGNAEAPVVPDVIEAYRVMGALAEDDALMALDSRETEPDHRRACRPFSDNCGVNRRTEFLEQGTGLIITPARFDLASTIGPYSEALAINCNSSDQGLFVIMLEKFNRDYS